MKQDRGYNRIRLLIDNNRLDEALAKLEDIISRGEADDETYYLRGNIFRRRNDWKQAIDSFSAAIELNAQSPALTAREMAIKILNFYNTDMYNH